MSIIAQVDGSGTGDEDETVTVTLVTSPSRKPPAAVLSWVMASSSGEGLKEVFVGEARFQEKSGPSTKVINWVAGSAPVTSASRTLPVSKTLTSPLIWPVAKVGRTAATPLTRQEGRANEPLGPAENPPSVGSITELVALGRLN